jgi:hypothetical protein
VKRSEGIAETELVKARMRGRSVARMILMLEFVTWEIILRADDERESIRAGIAESYIRIRLCGRECNTKQLPSE